MHNSAEQLHVVLPPNQHGRDFFLGDLHGMYDALTDGLRVCGFRTDCDRLISVGDLIDRGPESMAALSLIEEPWFYAVRGNHEQMMLDAYAAEDSSFASSWKANGGRWFDALPDDMRDHVVALAARLPIAISVQYGKRLIGVVHAEWSYPTAQAPDWAEVDMGLSDPQFHRQLLWGRRVIRDDSPVADKTADLTIHGHTPVERPELRGTALFIDTGCVYGGPLTIISAEEALTMVDNFSGFQTSVGRKSGTEK